MLNIFKMRKSKASHNRDHLILTRMATNKTLKQKIANIGEDGEKVEPWA